MTPRGKYIVIEGHDGTGKSTQVSILREKLREHSITSIEFHEPDGTPIAEAIRTVIKNGQLQRDAITNLLLFSAARHDIWFESALPALAQGTWVVESRNYYSTLAYQGYGEGLDKELISTITRAATDDQYLRPDIAMILNIDDEAERQQRIAARGTLEKPDTFESKDGGFQSRVKAGYSDIARSHNLPVIPAARSIQEISADIWALVSPALR